MSLPKQAINLSACLRHVFAVISITHNVCDQGPRGALFSRRKLNGNLRRNLHRGYVPRAAASMELGTRVALERSWAKLKRRMSCWLTCDGRLA
jgi:hypothetical protein